MEKSESIKNIAAAIGKFTFLQNKIGKDGKNPFFKSKYATLSKILESIEGNLREAGLVFSQFPDGDSLTTILIHSETGEYFQATYEVHAAKNDPQGFGSAITYARRYALTSILGLNVDDDDGERAQKPFRNNGSIKSGVAMKVVSDVQFGAISKRFLDGESDVFVKAQNSKFGFSKEQLKTIDELIKQTSE